MILFREREIPNHYVKNGKTAKGRQRYLDKRTGKTVTLTEGSIVKYTKKTYRQWSEYIQLMLYGLSLRDIAEAVKISATTAFHWRHKVIEAMREYKEEHLLKGEIQVDETYFLLNMNGKWSGRFEPRSSKKRGTKASRRGINQYHSELKTWISRFKSISTKHLENYLMWFRFMKYMKYEQKPNEYPIHTLNYTTSQYLEIKNSDVFEKPFPIDVYKPYQHLS